MSENNQRKYENLSFGQPMRRTDGGIAIDWVCSGVGYGQLSIFWDYMNQLIIDTDTDKETVKAILCKLVDSTMS